MASSSCTGSPSRHILLFPFMSKGHTVPLLDLARLFLLRNATVTIFTTPSNRHFISSSLSDVTVTIIDLPFPQNIDGIPSGVESIDKLPSMSLFVTFAQATKLIQPQFESALEKLPRVNFMITDTFLGWTVDSAKKFNIPRFVSHGMNNYGGAFRPAIVTSGNGLGYIAESDDELFAVPNFPWIMITRNGMGPSSTKGGRPSFNFAIEQMDAMRRSYGFIMNSFYELSPDYAYNYHRNFNPKYWSIGPLCLAQAPKINPKSYKIPPWIEWLDDKLEQGRPVLYVAFGSQAEVSPEQFEEIKIGLEISEANFLWVVRKIENVFDDGFEERVKGRGMVVGECVDQREILGHAAVKGLLSRCSWTSVLESVCAKVPILAWPMMADQDLNARVVVEEIKMGIRVETCDGSVTGFVKWEELEKKVRELMEGKRGKKVRKKAIQCGVAAMEAVEEGGSSWRTLNELMCLDFEDFGSA